MSKDTGRLTSFKRKELGASQIGTLILGHGYVSPNEILQMAVDEYNDIPIGGKDNPKMEAGRELEDAISKMFSNEISRQTGSITISEYTRLYPEVSDLSENKRYHHLHDEQSGRTMAHFKDLANGKLGASIDRILEFRANDISFDEYGDTVTQSLDEYGDKMADFTDSNNKNIVLPQMNVVEIKNYSGLPTDPVSPHHEYQLQQQMFCADITSGFIVRLVRGWELQFFHYEADTKMQEEILLAGVDFWNRFDGVLEGKDFWYDPADTKEASKIYKGNNDKEVVNMDSEASLKPLIKKFVKARDEEKLAKIRKDEASLEIKMLMKEVELASHKGYVLRHTTSKRQKTKMIKIPDEFTETRVFTIKEMKEND